MEDSEFLLRHSTSAPSPVHAQLQLCPFSKWCGQYPSVFFIFSAQPSPTGELPILSHRASQSPPNTKKQRLSQVGNPPKILDLKAEAQLVPSYRTPPSGQGLVSHCLYSGMEKLGGKGMKLPHLMARKKLYFVHICTMRWLPLCIQRNWTQYTLWHFFLWILVTVSPHFLLLSSSFPQRGKRKLLNQWKVLII